MAAHARDAAVGWNFFCGSPEVVPLDLGKGMIGSSHWAFPSIRAKILSTYRLLPVASTICCQLGWKSHPIIVITKTPFFPASLILKPKHTGSDRAFALMQSIL